MNTKTKIGLGIGILLLLSLYVVSALPAQYNPFTGKLDYYGLLPNIKNVSELELAIANDIEGYTTSNFDGDISLGADIGYVAANAICATNFSGSHFCQKSEVLGTINNGNYTFTGTAWFANGPPGYTANADDCVGWTSNANTFLGPFWNWDGNAQAGYGRLTNCAQLKPLMCCS